MEIRGKKCVLCGHKTGMMNTSCSECDGEELVVFSDELEGGDDAFWGVTVSKPIENSKQAWEFEETVLGSTESWKGYYTGHAVDATAVRGVGVEINLVDMRWHFEQTEGHFAVDLQDYLFGLRPGLMTDAVISVEFFDINEIEEVE
tara:strand:+ start:27 stop:464 length:438 start_codon:yes stop_codon:yes gene_type:complete